MKTTNTTTKTLALLPAALLVFTSCSSTPPEPKVEASSVVSTQTGVPGGVVVETIQVTANVTAVDAATRSVTLVNPEGKKSTIKCGPEVINFDQIRVGDQLKLTVVEELAVHMGQEAATSTDGSAAAVILAPKGSKPGGVAVSTVQVTAKVTAIDLANHKATLQFSDGSTRTVAVRPDVDLNKRKVGEEVVIRVTESVAISVEKP